MITFLVASVLAATPAPLPLPAQADATKTIATLGQAPPPHPYLVFSDEEKPALLARIKADPRSAEIFETVLLEGRRLLLATTRRQAPAREIHTRYVGADDYRRYVNEHLNAAFTLAFLYQMTGDTRYVAKAFEHADIVSAQDSWVQSAHYFEVIYPRVWPYGAGDDQVVFSYDITASATSQRMAYVYDWLHPALTRAQRDRIRGALLEKGITRVRGSYEYHWWATAYKTNWSGICHSGLGLAALALLHEDPQLTDVVARSHEGVAAMLDHIGTDGGWQEGRSYWAYGVGESVRFIEALKRVTGGKVNLFDHRAISPRPADFALFGLTGAFGDGTGTPVGESYVLNKLVTETKDPTAAWYLQNFVRPREDILELLWPRPELRGEPPADGSKHFPSIDWAFLRKDFSADSVTIATKAGMNDDPHHGHLDVGTFNLTWQNLTFIGEVPRTPYDEQFFGALRWDYLQARTIGHNTVTVNDEEQLVAKLKDRPWQEGIGGRITSFHSDPSFGFVVIDATRAYPGTHLKSWTRAIALDKDTNVVVVVDRVGCAPGAEIAVRFHPGVEFAVEKDRVTLHGAAAARAPGGPDGVSAAPRERTQPRGGLVQLPAEGGRAPRRSDLDMVPLVAGGSFTLVQGRQPDLAVMQDAQVTWAPYVNTVVKATAEETVIATVFAPAGVASELVLGSEPGSAVVTGTVEGKPVRFSFAADGVTRTP
jgi:hypothetical protein